MIGVSKPEHERQVGDYVCAQIAFDNGSNMEHDWLPVYGSLEIEYRVYDADDEFYASASGPNAEAEARRYIEQPGDYITKTYIIEERI